MSLCTLSLLTFILWQFHGTCSFFSVSSNFPQRLWNTINRKMTTKRTTYSLIFFPHTAFCSETSFLSFSFFLKCSSLCQRTLKTDVLWMAYWSLWVGYTHKKFMFLLFQKLLRIQISWSTLSFWNVKFLLYKICLRCGLDWFPWIKINF